MQLHKNTYCLKSDSQTIISLHETYCKNSQIHNAPDGKEVADSILEYFQSLFNDVIDDESAMDDSAAENKEVIAVDVLDQLDRSKSDYTYYYY